AVAGDPEQPEPVLRRRRDAVKSVPGDGERVRDHVVRLGSGDTSPDVSGDVRVAGGVEGFETGPVVGPVMAHHMFLCCGVLMPPYGRLAAGSVTPRPAG